MGPCYKEFANIYGISLNGVLLNSSINTQASGYSLAIIMFEVFAKDRIDTLHVKKTTDWKTQC